MPPGSLVQSIPRVGERVKPMPVKIFEAVDSKDLEAKINKFEEVDKTLTEKIKRTIISVSIALPPNPQDAKVAIVNYEDHAVGGLRKY